MPATRNEKRRESRSYDMTRIAVAGATGRVGPVPARILRAAQFHEFVEVLMGWGRQGDVVYLPKMRTQIVGARTVAEALAELARSDEPEGERPAEIAGPREEYLPDLARLLAAKRGDQVTIEA